MHDIALPFPPLLVLRATVAAVWLYEGLWCKLLAGEQTQVQVVTAVPRFGPLVGRTFLKLMGVVEVALAAWIVSGATPGLCAVTQTVLLVALNISGLLWARHLIHDPAGMVVKNIAFLTLAWVCAAIAGASR